MNSVRNYVLSAGLALLLAGCATTPTPTASPDPGIYRPTNPIVYPTPHE